MQVVGGIAGAIIGFVVTGGNPAGAAYGFMIGSAIGSMFDGPGSMEGPKINDLPVQTSKPGVPIPIGWGIVHLRGNIIQMNPIEEVVTSESQGKGAPDVETTTYYRTFAIGMCRGIDGPIKGVLRIWENDKLVYDTRDVPDIAASETAAYAANLRFYLGTETQNPDPDLEAHVGIGNCPYYRGLSYTVWVDYDLTGFGAAIPQYRFEIEVDGAEEITSTPYPLEALGGVHTTVTVTGGVMVESPNDATDISVIPQSLTMRQILKSSGPVVDDLDLSVIPQSLVMRQILKSSGPFVDDLDVSVIPQSLTMTQVLVSTTAPPDGVTTTVTVTGGSMTAV